MRNIHLSGGYVIRTYIFNITKVTGMVVMQQNDGQSSLDAPGLQLRTVNVVCCFAAESDDFRVQNDVYYNGDSSYATNRKRQDCWKISNEYAS